jgi:hypothetical protein
LVKLPLVFSHKKSFGRNKMNYCKGLVEDIVTRILKEPSGCCSCDARKKLCKNFAADYTHFKHDVCILSLLEDFNFFSPYASMYPDLVLTYIHNCNVRKPSKEDIETFIQDVQWFVRWNDLTLINHADCLNDNVPNYLICIDEDPDIIQVFVYDDVWDYYKNRTHSEFWFESNGIKRMYFRDWIKSFE